MKNFASSTMFLITLTSCNVLPVVSCTLISRKVWKNMPGEREFFTKAIAYWALPYRCTVWSGTVEAPRNLPLHTWGHQSLYGMRSPLLSRVLLTSDCYKLTSSRIRFHCAVVNKPFSRHVLTITLANGLSIVDCTALPQEYINTRWMNGIFSRESGISARTNCFKAWNITKHQRWLRVVHVYGT